MFQKYSTTSCLPSGQSGMTGGDDKSQTKEDGADTKVKTTLKGSMGERITKALNKVEEKKRKRAQRRAQVCTCNDNDMVAAFINKLTLYLENLFHDTEFPCEKESYLWADRFSGLPELSHICLSHYSGPL
jgi:hypothetical protein